MLPSRAAVFFPRRIRTTPIFLSAMRKALRPEPDLPLRFKPGVPAQAPGSEARQESRRLIVPSWPIFRRSGYLAVSLPRGTASTGVLPGLDQLTADKTIVPRLGRPLGHTIDPPRATR